MTAQTTLFDQVTAPSPGATHRTDGHGPTSTAADMGNRLRWGTQRARLLEIYAAVTVGISDEEAGKRAGIDHVAATRRVSELLKAGLLVDTRVYTVTDAGNVCRTCRITPDGCRALAAMRRPT